jgi:ABC-type Zn uptake system ZnuABC Zn-binding protein ZnuA
MTQPNEQLIEEIKWSLKQSEKLPSYRDHIENNADRWLRDLLEENKRLRKSLEAQRDDFLTLHTDFQQTREELERVRASAKNWNEAAEGWEKQAESLRTELSAKDKVLELYAGEDMYTVLHLGCSPMVMADRGGQARSILSQYVKEEGEKI